MGYSEKSAREVRLMPVVHHNHKQIQLKVVYYGPGLGGKTTNLKFIHANTRPELRGKLLSLNTESERTLFFDLLPVELGDFKGYSIRLHLCTVPGQIFYNKTRQLILRHVDGVVFVADSQEFSLDANIESVANLEHNLAMVGEDSTRLPLVVQYNKRDLPTALPVSYLREQLGIPAGVPEIEAVAREGVGVVATMKTIVRSCLALVGDPAKATAGRTPSMLPHQRPSLYPGGRLSGFFVEGSGELSMPGLGVRSDSRPPEVTAPSAELEAPVVPRYNTIPPGPMDVKRVVDPTPVTPKYQAILPAPMTADAAEEEVVLPSTRQGERGPVAKASDEADDAPYAQGWEIPEAH